MLINLDTFAGNSLQIIYYIKICLQLVHL